MNGSRYLELLKKLENHMSVHQCDAFMHDSVACHRSTIVSLFLQKVKTLGWPGNSADLIPNENLWTN